MPSDVSHRRACRTFARLRSAEAALFSTSYVLVETYSLIDRRLGRRALVDFRSSFAPLVDVIWVDERLHERGLDLLQEKASSGWSLVDAVSYAALPALEIDEVFA
ncbi:MAG: hypothetical protein HY720_09945 [Planctomycetes bacterium]|nr:hypothetical protein [Planctomycetota bacterium]